MRVGGSREHLEKKEGGDERWANVVELISAAARYHATGVDGLERFLTEVKGFMFAFAFVSCFGRRSWVFVSRGWSASSLGCISLLSRSLSAHC